MASRLRRALRGGHHDTDQVGDVARAELLHDVGAVVLDGTRADAERAAGFLVGRTAGELLEHLTLPARQRLASGEVQLAEFRRHALRLPACIGPYRLIQPADDLAAAERLLDEVERAALD